jgi:hypothetical protein
MCTKCSSNVIEDELHFLFECPKYDEDRESRLLNFPSVFFRRRLISVFEILRDQQIDHEMIQYPW